MAAGGFAVLLVGVAGWKTTCWFFRTILGIPKYPPAYEPEAQQLPYYLDDRIDSPKL
jgi:hypothetical protein